MKQLNLYESVGKNIKRQDDSVLDLYAGAGGLGCGFEQFFYVAVAVENNLDAYQTYKINHPKCKVELKNVGDYINGCTPKDFEILIGVVGGPPCQAFSILNAKRDCNSPRANELGTMVSAILTVKPKFALIENVKSVPKWYKEMVVKALRHGGYKVVAEVVQAYDFGSVQKRPRWILTASQLKHTYPVGSPSGRTAKEILRNDKCKMKMSKRVYNAIQNLPSGKWVGLTPTRFKAYFIIDPDKPVPAVVNPTKLRYIHPNRQRYLSMREMALAQGFPEDYKFIGKTSKSVGQQLANAVPVELASAFAKEFAIEMAS